MKFPSKENDIVALAERMVSGYTEHAADFPSVDVAELQTVLNDYQADRQSQSDARSQGAKYND